MSHDKDTVDYVIATNTSAIDTDARTTNTSATNTIDKTIIGMGGVNSETIPQVLELGFKGIGVLGGVWNAENPVESFISIKEKYDSLY